MRSIDTGKEYVLVDDPDFGKEPINTCDYSRPDYPEAVHTLMLDALRNLDDALTHGDMSEDTSAMVAEVVILVTAIDRWMSFGGRLPKAWDANRQAPLRSGPDTENKHRIKESK